MKKICKWVTVRMF